MQSGELNSRFIISRSGTPEAKQGELAQNVEIARQIIEKKFSEDSFLAQDLIASLAENGCNCDRGYGVRLLNELNRQNYIQIIPGSKTRYKKRTHNENST